ncbi:MAG: type II toxin-antitoxin system VapC family toxin [Victivallales bacterium]|nr:type II toxin-antitoxin system VapC family toxin [Victivallales bacterium]
MLYDTDVLVWAMRGSKKAADVINRDEERIISAISYMELMQGSRNNRELLINKSLLKKSGFTILPVNEAISHRAMVFIEEYALKSGLHLTNALIFATACEHSLTLCSGNEKHFRDIPLLDTMIFKP